MATIKQKLAFKEVLNGSTITSAMSKAGYADTTASTTGKLTSTKGWKELMDQHLPDSALAKKHRELLNKKETIRHYDEESKRTVIEKTDEIDVQAVTKGLDMAYKIKGRYEGTSDGNKTLIVMITGETAKRYAIPSITSNSGSESETI